jgi:parallel beta-helix repeat protein
MKERPRSSQFARRLGIIAVLATITAALLTVASPQQNAYAAPPKNPSPFLVTRSGSTYTAASQTTSKSYTGTLKSVVESAVADLNSFTAGGTVTFSGGTFDLGSDFFVLHDIHDIVFQGQGMDQTVIQNVNDAAEDTEPFNFSTATRVTIRDLTVSAGGVPRTTSDAIDFDNGSHSIIDHVKITSSRARGIIFDGKGDAGSGSLWAADFNVVSNCAISGTQSAAGDGIEFLSSNNNQVYGCTISDVANNGINITKASTLAFSANKKSNDNYIHDNTIEGSARHGIVVNSSDGNRIENNTLRNNGKSVAADGIRINTSDSITAVGNRVSGNLATDTQAVKTQQFGLNIADALCNGTVVGANNLEGNAKDPIQDLGTNTQYLTDTLPFSDGFESGDLSRWTHNSGLTAQQGTVSAGSWAVQGLTNGTGGASATKQLSPSKTNLYYAIRFKVGSRNASTPINLMRFRNTAAAASPIATLSVTATSRIQLRNDVTGVSTLSNTVAADGVWHQAQVHIVVNGTSSQTEVWVDGNVVPELNLSGINLGTTPIGRIELGDPSTTKTYNIYYDEVRASGSFITDADSEPPTAATNLQASAHSGLEVDLSWTAATDNIAVAGYDIYRNAVLLTTIGAATSYADKTVAPLTSYTYTVVARDGAGNLSPASGSAFVTTPDIFADDFESGSLSKWTSVSGLTAQQDVVDRGQWAARATSDGTAGASAQVRLDATVSELYYRVRFKRISQGSTNSVSLARVRTAANDAVASAFINSTGSLSYRNDTVLGGNVVTSQTKVSSGIWHELQMHVLVNGSTSHIELWLDGVQAVSNDDSFGTDPIGRLELGDPAGGRVFDVAFDNVVTSFSFVTDSGPPTAPANLHTTSVTESGVALAWDPADDDVGVTSYRIYRNGNPIDSVDGSPTTYTDTNVSIATSYTYTVRALDAVGHESAASNAVDVIVGDTTKPSTPTGLAATPVSAQNKIDLSWSASTDNVGVAGYNIYRNGGTTPFASVGGQTLSWSDTGVTPLTDYTYTVTAIDAAGNESAASDPVTAHTDDVAPPSKPAGLAATAVSGTRIDLSWNASNDNVGVTRYRIYRNGGATPIGSVDGSTLAYSDTGLNMGTTYTYTVTAVDAAGNESAASDSASATTPDTGAPTAPSGVAASVISDSEITVTWNASSDNVGVTGYRLYRNGSATPVGSVGGSTLTYADSNLSADTAYTYTVTAVDAAGNESAASSPASATTDVFVDGFETGNLSKWTTVNGLTTQTTNVFAGSWAAEARSNKNTAAYAVKQLPSTATNLYYRVRFNVLVGKPDTVDILRFRTASGANLLALYYDSKKKLGYRNEVGNTSTNSSTTLATGTWYEALVHVVVNGSSSQVEVFLNGSKITALSRTDSLGTTPIGQVVAGESLTGRAYDFALDNVRITRQP